jgi:D-alanine transaminase
VVLSVGEVYLNGAFMPLAEARIPVMDRGFLFGDGVYEVIPVYGGRPFRLPQHLDRLDNSLAAIRLANPLSRGAWSEIFARLLGAGPGDQSLYVQVTRGADSKRNHLFPAAAEPTVFAMAWEAQSRRPEIASEGVAAITLEDLRWLRCDIKSVALLGNVLLRQAAEDAGTEESILIRDGRVTEGSSTNVFLVAAGRIVTPPKTNLLLPGITRDLVLELAREAGLPCAEREVPREELEAAEEVWLTSSSREVVAVTRLDGRPVGDGRPGPLWHRIDGLYQDCKARLPGAP